MADSIDLMHAPIHTLVRPYMYKNIHIYWYGDNHPLAPVAVDEEEALEKSKLSKGKVGGHHCRPALSAADAAANVGRLDHPNIVGTVPNAESDGSEPSLHHLGNLPWPSPQDIQHTDSDLQKIIYLLPNKPQRSFMRRIHSFLNNLHTMGINNEQE
eukprot:scaffold3903_cov29-Prasinocladus_malaysianus.AAC.1